MVCLLAAGSSEGMAAAVVVRQEGVLVLAMAWGSRAANTLGAGLEALVSAKLVLLVVIRKASSRRDFFGHLGDPY